MKLGNDRIVIVTRTASGTDDRGNDVMVESFTEVRWCSVSPGVTSESMDRAVPTISGLTVLAPPAAPLDIAAAVIWPAFATGGDPAWSGPRYEVVGDPGNWGTAVQVHLERQR